MFIKKPQEHLLTDHNVVDMELEKVQAYHCSPTLPLLSHHRHDHHQKQLIIKIEKAFV